MEKDNLYKLIFSIQNPTGKHFVGKNYSYAL